MTKHKRTVRERHTWNHRVIVHPGGYLAIHEVYYTDNKPIQWTENAVGVGGDNLEEMLETIARIQRAITKPWLKIVGKKLIKTRAGRRKRHA